MQVFNFFFAGILCNLYICMYVCTYFTCICSNFIYVYDVCSINVCMYVCICMCSTLTCFPFLHVGPHLRTGAGGRSQGGDRHEHRRDQSHHRRHLLRHRHWILQAEVLQPQDRHGVAHR